MADITNLTNFLGDIADAIRTKKETTEQIPAASFDTEILSINTIKGQEKTIIPSTAEQIITPDGDYNAITKATIKAVDNTIDSNISPENIKKNINILGVTGTLEEGTPINNQDKTITANGTYIADEGYTGLGTVTVNVPQTGEVPVKLFKTEEQMQADTTAQEGDLAVVYRSEVKNATVDSHFKTATFPETVVLDTVITDYVEVRYRAVDSSKMFDCMGQLDSSRFMMDCYTETGEVRIQYTSSDGITYTRTDTTGNPVDFGTEIYYAYPEMWNDVIGKFIQVGGNTFEGLYEYRNTADDNWYDVVTKYNVDKTNKIITSENELVYLPTLSIVLNKFSKTEGISTFVALRYNNEYYIQTEATGTRIQQDITNNKKYSGEWSSAAIVGKVSKIYKLNLDDNTYAHIEDITSFRAFTRASNTWYDVELYMDGDIVALYVNGSLYNDNQVWVIENDVNYDYNQFDYSQVKIHHTVFPHYTYVSTQLSFDNPNQILPGKIAYGKKGVLTGDGTIYDNLDYSIINGKYFENPDVTTELKYVGGSTALNKNGFKVKKLIRDDTSTNNFYVCHTIANTEPIVTQFDFGNTNGTELVYNGKVYIVNNDNVFDILETDINTGEQYHFEPLLTGYNRAKSCMCINRQAGLLFTVGVVDSNIKICKYDLVNRTSSILATIPVVSKKLAHIGLMGYDEISNLLYFNTGDLWGDNEPADIYSVNSSGTYTKVVTTNVRHGYTHPVPLYTDNYIVLTIGALKSNDRTFNIYYKAKGETSFKVISGTNLASQGREFDSATAYDSNDGYLLITVYDSSAKKNYVIKINTTNNTYVRTEGEITIPYQFIMGKTSDKLLSIHGISDLNGYNYTKPLTTGNGMFYNYTNYGIGTIQQILIDTSGVHITDYIPVKTTDLSDTTEGMLVALLYKNNSSNATWYSISDLNYNILGRKST